MYISRYAYTVNDGKTSQSINNTLHAILKKLDTLTNIVMLSGPDDEILVKKNIKLEVDVWSFLSIEERKMFHQIVRDCEKPTRKWFLKLNETYQQLVRDKTATMKNEGIEKLTNEVYELLNESSQKYINTLFYGCFLNISKGDQDPSQRVEVIKFKELHEKFMQRGTEINNAYNHLPHIQGLSIAQKLKTLNNKKQRKATSLIDVYMNLRNNQEKATMDEKLKEIISMLTPPSKTAAKKADSINKDPPR